MFLGRGNYAVEPRPAKTRPVKKLSENDQWIIDKTRQEAYQVVNQFRHFDLKTIKHHVRRVYVFGDRRGRTYKIWNKQIHILFKALDEGTFQFSE
jgi:hypothetical protein